MTAAVLALALMAGCTSDPEARKAGPADTDATLTFGLGSGTPTSLDPHMAVSMRLYMRFGMWGVYDRLFTVTAKGQTEGMLVSNYRYSADGLALVLDLREDVKFRDGTPIDAKVVALNLERARTLESPVVKARMSDVSKTAATGPFEVTLSLKSPTPDIPAALAESTGFIMHPDLIKNGDPATQSSGSGPYVVKSFVPGESMTIVRDGTYWDKDAASIKTITYETSANPQAYVNAMQGGQIDLGDFQPGQTIGLESNPEVEIVKVDQGISVQLALNRDLAPLTDLRVRQALNFAIDRKGITRALYPGSRPMFQQFRKGLSGHVDSLDSMYSYDAKKSKQLLTQAGHAGGVDLGTVLVNADLSQSLSDVILEQLTAAGFTVKFETGPGPELIARFAEGRHTAMLNYYLEGMSPGAALKNRWVSTTYNPSGTTASFDEGLLAATNQLTPAQLDAAYQGLSRTIAENAWSVPVIHMQNEWAMNSHLAGLSPDTDYVSTLGLVDLRYARVER